jgi:hypothetical protein
MHVDTIGAPVVDTLRTRFLTFLAVHKYSLVIGILIAGSCLFLWKDLFPRLGDLNWDEAAYISNGRFMVDRGLIPLASGPLTGLLYGVPYVVLKEDTFWMLKAATVGRIAILALFWLGMALLRKEFGAGVHPLIYPVLWAFTAPMQLLLANSSDGLFAAFSAIALYFLYLFLRKKNPKHLLYSSAMIAVAAMARVDGILLFATTAFALLLIGVRRKTVALIVLFFIAPFSLIIGFYLLMSDLSGFSFDSGLLHRSYMAFEHGEGFVAERQLEMDGRFPPVVGVRESEKLYGTAEANGNSILRAIRSNPGAFGKRVMKTLLGLPQKFGEAYGSVAFPVLAFFALIGLVSMYRESMWVELSVLALWSAPLAAYCLTFFSARYLALPYFVVMIAAAAGLQRAALFFAIPKRVLTSAIIVLAVIQVIFSTTVLEKRELGSQPDEKAVAYLRQNFHDGVTVAAFDPRVPYAALQSFADISMLLPQSLASESELFQWLRDRGINVIYLDPQVFRFQPRLGELFEQGENTYWLEAFSADDWQYRIYVMS